MVGHFKETGHPVFKGISALNRGILKRRGGRCTKHFEADSSNTELLIRTIHSANHFSICRAVASWCEEMAQRIPSQNELTAEKSVAEENEHLLQNVKPQEGETECKNNFRDLKHWDFGLWVVVLEALHSSKSTESPTNMGTERWRSPCCIFLGTLKR